MPRVRSDVIQRAAEQQLIREWDPATRPVHCSNCAHTRVSGAAEDPVVRCAKGYGTVRSKDLWVLIRPSRPDYFRRAADCPDFASMSDDAPGVPATDLIAAIVEGGDGR